MLGKLHGLVGGKYVRKRRRANWESRKLEGLTRLY